jgi:cysteinyl-tRNA synthetase
MGGLDAARNSLQRLRDFVLRLFALSSKKEEWPIDVFLNKNDSQFRSALADDLNISAALAVLFDLVRELNTFIDQDQLGKQEAEKILTLLHRWDLILAFLPLHLEEEIPPALALLLEQREKARLAKDFALSDHLRNQILSLGYLIEDTPRGARLKKSN